MTGIRTNDECVELFNSFKLDKSLRYIIFRMDDKFREIIVEKKGERDATYDDFVADLPPKDCRYAVYDYEYEVDGNPRSKILFYSWNPNGAKVRSKMLYASTKESFKKKLVGLGIEIQATDMSELDKEEVEEKVQTATRK